MPEEVEEVPVCPCCHRPVPLGARAVVVCLSCAHPCVVVRVGRSAMLRHLDEGRMAGLSKDDVTYIVDTQAVVRAFRLGQGGTA